LQDDAARAHLAASIYLQMAVEPHIVHIVGHTEAHHAATAEDIIQASRMARQAIENALKGQPDMTKDPMIQKRVEELIQEAAINLQAVCSLAPQNVPDPLTDPGTLTKAVMAGVLDAPHLKNNPFAQGAIQTRIVDGACVAVDSAGNPISESDRLHQILKEEL